MPHVYGDAQVTDPEAEADSRSIKLRPRSTTRCDRSHRIIVVAVQKILPEGNVTDANDGEATNQGHAEHHMPGNVIIHDRNITTLSIHTAREFTRRVLIRPLFALLRLHFEQLPQHQ